MEPWLLVYRPFFSKPAPWLFCHFVHVSLVLCCTKLEARPRAEQIHGSAYRHFTHTLFGLWLSTFMSQTNWFPHSGRTKLRGPKPISFSYWPLALRYKLDMATLAASDSLHARNGWTIPYLFCIYSGSIGSLCLSAPTLPSFVRAECCVSHPPNCHPLLGQNAMFPIFHVAIFCSARMMSTIVWRLTFVHQQTSLVGSEWTDRS